eukprot:1161079-Pelagomonas_calceolata.AAC.7
MLAHCCGGQTGKLARARAKVNTNTDRLNAFRLARCAVQTQVPKQCMLFVLCHLRRMLRSLKRVGSIQTLKLPGDMPYVSIGSGGDVSWWASKQLVTWQTPDRRGMRCVL